MALTTGYHMGALPLRIFALYDQEPQSKIDGLFRNHLFSEHYERRVVAMWIQSLAGTSKEGFSQRGMVVESRTIKTHSFAHRSRYV